MSYVSLDYSMGRVPQRDRISLRAVSVPLEIETAYPTPSCRPVTVGIPCPKGTLADPGGLAVFDPEDRPLPLQVQPLAHWSRQTTAADRLAAQSSLRFWNTSRAILVETGAVTFFVDRRVLRPFVQVKAADDEMLETGSSGIALTTHHGRRALGRVERVAMECSGPARVTLRLAGCFPGRAPCRFLARLSFFADTGFVRLDLTIHNPRRARHRGGLWDLGDRGSILFRDLSLELAVSAPARPLVSWTPEFGQAPRQDFSGRLELYQDSSGGDNWHSRNHVNREGRVPCTFRGYRVRTGNAEENGLRASPIVSLEGPNGTAMAVAVPEFWQQFPKAIEVEGRILRVRLFPHQFGDLHELQGGEQKTHTIWLHFGQSEAEQNTPLDWVHQPAYVHAPPDWYAASRVFPSLLPPSGKTDARFESLLAEVTDGPQSLLARREIIDEYGWRHFGEVYADHEAAGYDGPAPIISHYNNQYDVVYGFLLQFLRTGRPLWFELGRDLARHVLDIDIYHTDQDKPAYNGGLFWFTDHHKTAATATHRTYSRANCRPGDRSYGGGPASQHNYTTGLLHYYYLTGDPQARDAVLSLAAWVVNMDDGSKTLLGLLDNGPTGLATTTRHADYHGPGRGSGYSINALLDAWLLTQDRWHLLHAETLLRRSIHPADDVDARDLLNVEVRWSYTVFLSVLARYLDLKVEADMLDEMYAYAQASLLRYARWMAENERPYLDHPERLALPTETWPAQDFRKANVLRLAARHVEEPLRAHLLARAEALADRAWSDLISRPTRASTRAIAIVFVEGLRDSFFRSCTADAALQPPAAFDFGTSNGSFVPQRLRVFSRLTTVGGLAGAFATLAHPRTLPKLFSLLRGRL
ncbi:MAG: hypothetical protein HY000_12720 [Planctomycetes bacterium]|nr:hypothetical protein [Planctomycetota bacterium]